MYEIESELLLNNITSTIRTRASVSDQVLYQYEYHYKIEYSYTY